MAETTRQRKFREFNKRQDERDHQKELKDRYDTGTTDEDIAVAKQQAAEMAKQMMQPAGQGTMGYPAPAKMPELKTKDTGDKNEVDIKGVLPEGYKNAKPVKKGGAVKKMAKGGTASSRADGCAVRGKTKA